MQPLRKGSVVLTRAAVLFSGTDEEWKETRQRWRERKNPCASRFLHVNPVARDVQARNLAGKLAKHIFDERDSAFRPAKRNADPLLLFPALFDLRKEFREGLLILLQDVDAEALFFLEQRQRSRAVIHANRNERGIE